MYRGFRVGPRGKTTAFGAKFGLLPNGPDMGYVAQPTKQASSVASRTAVSIDIQRVDQLREPAIADIGLADRAPDPMIAALGCQQMKSMDKQFEAGKGRTENPNKLLNYSPESKMMHRRSKVSVKPFPVVF